jgi:hypothetical protein
LPGGFWGGSFLLWPESPDDARFGAQGHKDSFTLWDTLTWRNFAIIFGTTQLGKKIADMEYWREWRARHLQQ